jgi:hypothetical protein
MNLESLKPMLASYGRSFAAAAIAVYSTGNTDVKAILSAGLAAVLPVAMRALNPKDEAFGVVANTAAVELEEKLDSYVAESNAKAKKKAPAKKAVAKKTAKK